MNALGELIESGRQGSITINGVRVFRYGNGVLNINGEMEQLTREQLDMVRAELAAAGYREEKSWVATQGASWLNDGLFAGVSMRVEKVT